MRLRVLLSSWLLASCAVAHAAPFVLGTSQAEDTYSGKLQRRIYREAFRRLDVPLEFSVMPLQRLTISTDQGVVDGDVARVASYGASHPELVRVDEPVYDVVWALFSTNTAFELDSLAALSSKGWRATYLRGVGICERALKPLLPPDRLSDVTSDAQGFSMLKLGRTEVHCTADLSALTLQYTPEFRDVDILHKVVEIGVFPLHAYLLRRHADLAPRLAAVLRQMRTEGLIDRYRAEVQRDIERR